MASQTDYKFQGWMGLSPDAVNGKMEWQSYEPKNWQETDVDIKVTHCGICGSDLHTLRSGWVCGDSSLVKERDAESSPEPNQVPLLRRSRNRWDRCEGWEGC